MFDDVLRMDTSAGASIRTGGRREGGRLCILLTDKATEPHLGPMTKCCRYVSAVGYRRGAFSRAGLEVT